MDRIGRIGRIKATAAPLLADVHNALDLRVVHPANPGNPVHRFSLQLPGLPIVAGDPCQLSGNEYSKMIS